MKKFFKRRFLGIPLVAIIAVILAVGIVGAYASWQTCNLKGSGSVTITPVTLSTISVLPNPSTIEVGATQQFTVTATYSDGSVVTGITSAATWSTNPPVPHAIATVDSNGLVIGIAVGSGNVQATYNGHTNTAGLTVIDTCDWQVGGTTVVNGSTPVTLVFSTGTVWANDPLTATATLSVKNIGSTTIAGFNLGSIVYPITGTGWNLIVSQPTLVQNGTVNLIFTLTGTAPAGGSIDFSGITCTLTPHS